MPTRVFLAPCSCMIVGPTDRNRQFQQNLATRPTWESSCSRDTRLLAGAHSSLPRRQQAGGSCGDGSLPTGERLRVLAAIDQQERVMLDLAPGHLTRATRRMDREASHTRLIERFSWLTHCRSAASRTGTRLRFSLTLPAARRLQRAVSRRCRTSTVLWATRGNPAEHAFCADIFIDIRPVHSMAVAYEFPIGALRWRRVGQPPRPRQWHADDTPINQVRGDCFVVDVDAGDPRLNANRSAHAMPR